MKNDGRGSNLDLVTWGKTEGNDRRLSERCSVSTDRKSLAEIPKGPKFR